MLQDARFLLGSAGTMRLGQAVVPLSLRVYFTNE